MSILINGDEVNEDDLDDFCLDYVENNESKITTHYDHEFEGTCSGHCDLELSDNMIEPMKAVITSKNFIDCADSIFYNYIDGDLAWPEDGEFKVIGNKLIYEFSSYVDDQKASKNFDESDLARELRGGI